MRKLPALLAIGLAMAALSFGQAKPAPAHQRETTPAPAKTAAAPKKSDKEIEAAIRAKFAKSKINADKFTVHVQGGVATIEGHTEVVQHKGVATRLAKTGGRWRSTIASSPAMPPRKRRPATSTRAAGAPR